MITAQEREILNHAAAVLVRETRAGRVVRIRGLGVFEMISTPQRRGRNPRTGDEMVIQPREKMVFRAASARRRNGEKDQADDS